MKASALVASLGKPVSWEIMRFRDTGWTDWQKFEESDGEKLLESIGKCSIIEYNVSDSPSPSLPPPNWAVRCIFENGKSVEFEFLGSGSLVRMDRV